jgi:hypothetical protein
MLLGVYVWPEEMAAHAFLCAALVPVRTKESFACLFGSKYAVENTSKKMQRAAKVMFVFARLFQNGIMGCAGCRSFGGLESILSSRSGKT